MTDETPVEVLPGQMTIEDTDTASAEVHHGAVHEFDALPEGYAKVIQPMREYTPAEEFALDKSMELYGFQGAIVCDQYGRILTATTASDWRGSAGWACRIRSPTSGMMPTR